MLASDQDVRARLDQASRDAERMRRIAAEFRSRNPENADCDLFERAAAALGGVATRLLSQLSGSGEEVDAEAKERIAEASRSTGYGGVTLPANSRIKPPDRERRARGESREEIHGPADSGSLRGG